MGGAGNAFADKAEAGVIVHEPVLAGEHQPPAALNLCIGDGPAEQLPGQALLPVFGQGIHPKDHLPRPMGIVQGSVGVHLVCQVGGIGHKAVHKGDELFVLEQQPEVVGIMGQPPGKFFFCGRLRSRKAGRLHGGNGIQIFKGGSTDLLHSHSPEFDLLS